MATKNTGPSHARVAQLKQKQQSQVAVQKKKETAIWAVAVIAVVALFIGLITFINRQNAVGEINKGDLIVPTVADDTNGIPVGAAGEAGKDIDSDTVRVDVWFDFMCPACAAFEMVAKNEISDLVADGKVTVYYHPIAILDEASMGSNYSTRAAAVAALIAEESPEHFAAFMDYLFTEQPAQGTRGYNDRQLADIAGEVGVPSSVTKRIGEYEYSKWVTAATERASIDGLRYTPTLHINGEVQDPQTDPDAVNWSIPGALKAKLTELADQ